MIAPLCMRLSFMSSEVHISIYMYVNMHVAKLSLKSPDRSLALGQYNQCAELGIGLLLVG